MRDTIAQLGAVVLLALLGGLIFVGVEGIAYLIDPKEYLLPPANALPAVFIIASIIVLACGLFIGLPVVVVLRRFNLARPFPLVLAGATCAFVMAVLLSRTGYGGVPFFVTATIAGAFMGALWWILIERKPPIHG